jgi:phosphohistidine phosphatase
MAGWRRTPPTTCPYFTSDALKLILLRHAKSSWDDFTLDDHDRPLNDRGRASATGIGLWLNLHGHIPEIVACSTAVRAQETVELVCTAASASPDTQFEPGLYLASPDRILREAHKSQAGTLMLVGHNPGMAELAASLVRDAPHHKDFLRFPTASTLVLEFDVAQWRDARSGHGTVVDFVTPRDLAE